MNNDDGFDASKWYGADRKLYLPVRSTRFAALCSATAATAAAHAPRLQGGLLDPSEVPDYLDGTLAGECVPCGLRRARR